MATAQANYCRWLVKPQGNHAGTLEINGTTYDLLPVLSQGGRIIGYNLHKWDEAGTVYHVDTDFPRWECSCPDAKYRRRECKHAKALRAALERLQPA